VSLKTSGVYDQRKKRTVKASHPVLEKYVRFMSIILIEDPSLSISFQSVVALTIVVALTT